jgi:hypothetical protein
MFSVILLRIYIIQCLGKYFHVIPHLKVNIFTLFRIEVQSVTLFSAAKLIIYLTLFRIQPNI